MIESAAPQSHEDPATAVFKSLTGSEPERLNGADRKEAAVPSGVAGATPKRARTWLAVGAGALGSLLVLTLVVWGLGRRQGKLETAPAPSPPVTSAPTPVAPVQSPAPSSLSQTPAPSPADPPAPKPMELARAPVTKPTEHSQPDASENRPSAGPSTSGGKLAATSPAESKERARLASGANGSPAAVNSGKSSQFDPTVLARKPVKEKGTLKKILDASRFYSNQVVVPDGMYLLARSQTDRADGPRKYLVTERKIEEKKNNTLGMSSSPSTDLAVEPKLAERLDQLEADLWKDKMSILTLWFTRDGAGLLVKVEILEKATPRVKRVGYSVQADIEYETLLVTTEETRPFTANDAEWEQVGRMHSYAKAYKSRFKAYKQMVSNAQMNMIQTQMNGLFQNMMQSALIEDQKRLQLQRQLTR